MANDASKFDDLSMLDVFTIETGEHIKTMNHALLALEKDPDNKELIDKLFREAHTLKGAARLAKVTAVQESAHHMEDLFGVIRDGKRKAESDSLDLVFEALDTIEVIVESVQNQTEPNIDVAGLIGRLEKAVQGNVIETRTQAQDAAPSKTQSLTDT